MPSLRPSRALLHPAWLASVALLALNDAILKHAHVLPAWLTGKLSDVAGLFLAPALLAVVLRVRTRRGLVAAHAIVGVAFAVVKVVPAATQATGALLSLVIPSRLWTDPTDLLALPAIALAWRALVPWMAKGEAGRTRRALELAAAATASVFCVATSAYIPPPTLKNESGRTLTLRLAPLDDAVSSDKPLTVTPELPITRALFGEGEMLVLHAGDERALPANHGEVAILVEGTGWVTEMVPGKEYRITRGPGETLAFEAPTAIVPITQVAPRCGTDAVLEWEPLPAPGDLRVRSVIDLGGSCRQVDFVGASRPWRYCSPEAAWPFAVGDALVSTGDALVRRGPAPRLALVLSSSAKPIERAQPLCASVDACGSVLLEGVGHVGDLALRSGEVRGVELGGVTRTYFAGPMHVAPIRSSRCGTPRLEGGYAIVDPDWQGADADAHADAGAGADAGADADAG